MQLRNIIQYLENIAPAHYQESYDNAGLILGDPTSEISAALITLDVTDKVIGEAIESGCGLIITHHPLIFKGIKRITGSNMVERCLVRAIQNNLAIYAAHTNLDNMSGGVNAQICRKIGLQNYRILAPLQNQLLKLITYVPDAYLDQVRSALFAAGAGEIGNYDQCSFGIPGEGTFRPLEGSTPFAGTAGVFHTESETRLEVILPRHLKGGIVAALKDAHPYEEVAYDLIPLENDHAAIGSGMCGDLQKPMDPGQFLRNIKEIFGCQMIRHTAFPDRLISRVAVCGGSGSFLINKAIANKADVFISADFKYHDFFEAENKIILADIGHYESEQFTKELLKELLSKKFPTFALRLSAVKTNPVSYL